MFPGEVEGNSVVVIGKEGREGERDKRVKDERGRRKNKTNQNKRKERRVLLFYLSRFIALSVCLLWLTRGYELGWTDLEKGVDYVPI